MIFFGWGHYSKRNPEHRHGICEACGHAGQLHSYSCTKFAHLYWIPLLPLGSKRIIDQCPSCKAGGEMSLGEYKKLHAQSLLPSIEELRTKPTDKEAGLLALALATQFGSKEEFIEVVGMMAHHHTKDPEVLAQVGMGFNRFNMREDAEKLLSASLNLKDDEDLRQFLDFVKGQRDSKPPKTPGKIAQLWPMMITPMIILAVVGSMAFTSFTQKPENIFAVNGLWQPYSISVNGNKVVLPAQSETRLRIDFGQIEIKSESEAVTFEPIHHNLKSSFFSRIGGGPSLVFNPDQSAVLVREQIIYTKSPDPTNENNNSYSFLTGKTRYSLNDVDHLFESPPEEVKVSSSSRSAQRVHLYQLQANDPLEMVNSLLNNQATKDALSYSKKILDRDPSQDTLLAYVQALGKPDENEKYFAARIEEKPTQIEWHRMYQSAVEHARPDHDLEKEYQQRFAKHSNDDRLAYLLGRITNDKTAATKLFQQAASSSDQAAAAYGLNAIAFDQMRKGKFTQALTNIRKALANLPDKYNFVALESELMFAAGNFAEIIERNQLALKDNPFAQDKLLLLIQAQASSGEVEAAKKSSADYLVRLKKEGAIDAQSEKQAKLYFDATIALATKNTKEYIKLTKDIGEDQWAFNSLLVEGKYQEAGEIFKKLNDSTYAEHLLLYAAEMSAGRSKSATTHLSNGIAAIKTDSALGEDVADLFNRAPSIEEVLDATTWPKQSRVIFTALGFKYPKNSQEYFEQARLFNYKAEFPQTVLDQLLKTQ